MKALNIFLSAFVLLGLTTLAGCADRGTTTSMTSDPTTMTTGAGPVTSEFGPSPIRQSSPYGVYTEAHGMRLDNLDGSR